MRLPVSPPGPRHLRNVEFGMRNLHLDHGSCALMGGPAHSALRIPHSKTLAPHPTRGPHGSDLGLPPVGSQKRPRVRLGNPPFTLPSSPFPLPEQYDDRPAPPRAREPRAVRPGPPRRPTPTHEPP